MDESTRPLTPKQQQFCREYLIDMNASAAAKRAGYSEHTSEQQGSRLLRKVEVEAEIQRLIDERAERVEVDADYVVEKLRTMVEDPNCPASSQVQALGLLARHLGMLNDKIDINDSLVMRRLYGVPLQSPFHPKAQLNKHLPVGGNPSSCRHRGSVALAPYTELFNKLLSG